MTKYHTIQLNIGDFLSGTVHMDAQEIGAYTMLIMAHYQAGEEGLPYDDKRLARMAKVSPKVWKNIKEVILEKFKIVNDGAPKVVHHRIVSELRKASKVSAQNSAKALKKHRSCHATAEPQHSHGKAIQYTIPNIEKEDTNVSSKKDDQIQRFEFEFERFWEAFPRQRRGSKQNAKTTYRTALARASPDEIFSGLQAYADSDEVKHGFAKGAAAWLNDDRWTNDYSEKVKYVKSNGGNRRYTDQDALDEVLAELEQNDQPEQGQERPDCSLGSAMLCDSRHLRQDTRAVENSYESDDRGFKAILGELH